MWAKALIEIPPDSLIEAYADTNEDVLLALKAEALVDKIPAAQAERLGRTLGYAERQTTNRQPG